jgi:tetratricopeptide (TPR) repeat protein
MRKLFTILIIICATVTLAKAQQQDVKTLQQTAKTFIKQGDYTNAVLVLNKALEQNPGQLDVLKDILFAHYLNKDFDKALKVGASLPDRPDADVQTYQLVGMVYKAIEERKECEKLYKKGIKTFPNSGVLYNEYGEMLWTKQNYDAIKQWEKGIEVDPNFSGNYYNAAKYYYFTKEKVWGLLYGEIFVNLESYSKRTAEIKNLLLDGYKKLFLDADINKDQNTKNEFVVAYLNGMAKQNMVVNQGISPESITMLRTRFILDWYNNKNDLKFAFRLFDYQKQLLKEGMFDAYNQWLFGAAQNTAAFQNWTAAHNQAYQSFTSFQKGRIFKVVAGQNYQTK